MLLRDHPEAITSPYLLQHVHNPVDWHDWSPETLAKAETLNRPLLISIGYAACHWCHVMAHESFEDPAAAALVNQYFIPIKIDREERPDLDAIYMSACQTMNGHGGWPLTVFATPDGRPYYAATYFPPIDRGGQPSFSRVVITLADAYSTRQGEVESQADELAHAVGREARFVDLLTREAGASAVTLDEALNKLMHELGERFDVRQGGFGGAPKFPRPSFIEACLAHHARSGDDRSLTMATTTLDAMAAGGIYDHLAGGFARYSVDAHWTVPHFEKMLSDQALLVRCYARAFALTGNTTYAQVASETIAWVLSDLRLVDGGLAASIDADANGVEGSHATFSPETIEEALRDHGGVFGVDETCLYYDVSVTGNFEHGQSVLRRAPGESLLRGDREEATRRALLEHRLQRVQPTRDDKVILEWNAMFLAALCEAAAIMDHEGWTQAALALDAVLEATMAPQGVWLRSRLGSASGPDAMLGDLSWWLEAKLQLFELTGDAVFLESARELHRSILGSFADAEGGLFTTSTHTKGILMRAKDILDGALPSSTAVASRALARLSSITDDSQLLGFVTNTVHRADPMFERQPSSVPDLIEALGYLEAGVEVVIPGAEPELVRRNASCFVPYRVSVIGIHDLGLCEDRTAGLAYVCKQRACQMPAPDAATLETQLLDLRRAITP
jgi:hypothetical protein